MVGNRNELRVERLLQAFKIFDGISKHVLVIEAILEGVAAVLLSEVAGIKEIVVAPLFIGCISIPETTGISVDHS